MTANGANHAAIQVASGHDQTAGWRIDPQPETQGVQYAREQYSPLDTYVDGAFTVLRIRKATPQQLAEIFARMGSLSDTNRESNVTVWLPDLLRTTSTRYNGVAMYPRFGANGTFDQLYYDSVDIRIKRLVASS